MEVLQSVNDVSLQLLLELKNCSIKQCGIDKELLSSLNCMFSSTLPSALQIVDQKCVTCLLGSNGRMFYKVKGSSGISYLVLSSAFYCTCQSFLYTVLKKKSTLICKHILAVHIAQALNSTETVHLDEKNFSLQLLNG